MYFTAGEKRRMKLVALAALNATPLVGVLVLDWSLLALLEVYWVELGVRLGFASLEGLFAEGKPEYDTDAVSWLVIGALSEKRGGISVPGLPLSVQIATLPVILTTTVIGGLGWLLFGAIGVGGVSEATGANMSSSASVSAGLGIVAVTIGRAVEAGNYFVSGEYDSVSAQQPLRSVLLSVAGTGSALFFGGALVVAGAPGPLVLVAVFVVKLFADIVGHDRLFGPQWRLSREQLVGAERVHTVTDRLFGTETVLLERDSRTIRLPHIPPRAVAHAIQHER